MAPGRAAEEPASAAKALPVARPTAHSGTVDFHREILPALQASCLPCHNKTTAKAELLLETPADMLRGGESGPALVAGRAGESLLFRVASHEAKPRMPPKDNKVNAPNLTPEQLGLLALWIDQGAPAGTAAATTVAWQAIPGQFAPVLSVAVSADGRQAACGRANQVHLYHLPSQRFVGCLEDPALPAGTAQRDIVAALAFSPDGNLLAAGGYREVRLWRRQAPTATPLGPPVEPRAVAVSPEGRRVAASQPGGEVLLLDATDGSILRRLAGPTPAPDLLRFAPDGTMLAGASTNGAIRLWGLAGETRDRVHSSSHRIRDLAWLGSSREITVAADGSPALHTLAVPAGDEPGLVPGPDLEVGPSPTLIVADGSPLGGRLVASGEDGSVRFWPADPGSPPQVVVPAGPPVTFLAVAAGPRSVAVAGPGRPTRLWPVAGAPGPAVDLPTDPRLAGAVASAERTLAFQHAEQDFQKGALQRGEEEWRKATNAVAEATTKSQAASAALAEKEQGLAEQEKARAAAEAEKGELTARVQQAKQQQESARQAAEDARTAARAAADRLAEAERAATDARRTQADLERLLAGLAGSADAPTAANARETAETAAREAGTRQAAADEAKAAAGKAIDDLAARASAAGEAKAVAERTDTETKPSLKAVEERLAAAAKAIDGLRAPLARARIQRDTAEADLALAHRNEAAAQRAVDEARAALATADVAAIRADAAVRDAGMARDAAGRRGHSWLASDPAGTRLAAADGATVTLWSLPGAGPLSDVDVPPLSRPVGWLADDSVLVVRAGGLARVATRPRWGLAGTLGSGDAQSPILDRVTALAFSPDGRLLAAGGGEPSRSGQLQVWSVDDGALARDFGSVHSDAILALAFSPQGEWLASGGADRFLRLTEVATGRRLRNFEGHTHHVLAVAWTADGRTLGSAGAEGTVKLWNARTGDRLKNVDGFGKEVTGLRALGISQDLLAVSGSGQARVFRPDGSQVRTLPAGGAFLHALDVTPDGTLAVAGGDDGVLRIWSVGDGKTLAELGPGSASAGAGAGP